MTDILDEINESTKEHKTNKILGRATAGLFALGIITIIYLGISSWYNSRKDEKIQEEGALLTQIVNKINNIKIQDKNPDEQKKIEEMNNLQTTKLEKLAERNSSAYSALANFYLASLSLLSGNHTKAIYYYQRVEKDSDSKTLKEYSKLVEINAKLQFNEKLYETPLKKLDEYFSPYVKDNKIEHDIAHDKIFSDAIALTAIAANDSAGKTEKTKLYLTALKQNDKPTENVSFIIDILSQYISQKSNDK
jgi:predicted negative regulator of RcsB-dependent stress response